MADDSTAEQDEAGLETEEPELEPDNLDEEAGDPGDAIGAALKQSAESLSQQPAEAGQVEGQELETPAEGAPSEEPPQHPDNVDIEAMTDAEYGEWAQENPAAARRMAQRQADYTKKTDEVARERKELEAEKIAFYEDVVRRTEANEGAPAETPASIAGMDAESARFLQELTAKLGHEPSIAEFAYHAAQDAAQKQVKPFEEQQQQQETTAMANRFREQLGELQEEHPEATAPEVVDQIIANLEASGSKVPAGAVEKAFYAEFGKEREQKLAAAKQDARQKQKAASEQEPTTAPAAAGGEPAVDAPPTVDGWGSWAKKNLDHLLGR